MEFSTSQTVGEIVAAFPGASNLLKKRGIDFCCGGHRTLGEVLRQKALAEGPFLTALRTAYAEVQRRASGDDADWRQAPYNDLIGRIVSTHHEYLKQELPVLSSFVTKICHVHGERHPELGQLYKQFHQLKMELDPHLLDEEVRLFPAIQAYVRTGSADVLARAQATLEELESEHQAAGELLHAMRQTTRDYDLPGDACRTYTLTFQKLQELESDLFTHIHLENNILFPRLRTEGR